MPEDVHILDHILTEIRELRRVNDEGHDRLYDKLDEKCDVEDCEKVEARVLKLEEKTSKLMVKQAGMAGVATGLALALKQMLGMDG